MLKAKINFKTAIKFGTLLVAIFVVGINSAKAEVATTTTDSTTNCKLNDALNTLLTVKDSALTGLARDRAEFKARKAVVDQTIICAHEEIQNAKEDLSKLNLTADDDKNLRIQFLNSLQSSDDTYAAYASSSAATAGLIDIKSLAEDILSWRKSEYLPLLNQVNDFILVITNEQSTKIARSRFDKISSTLSILQLSNVNSIKGLLNDSANLTVKANQLNAEAHDKVRNYLISTSTPDNSMLNATGTPEVATTTPSGDEKNQNSNDSSNPVVSPTVVSLIKQSIDSLQGAYADYLKISVLVKNILGL